MRTEDTEFPKAVILRHMEFGRIKERIHRSQSHLDF